MDMYKIITPTGEKKEIRVLFIFKLEGINYLIYTINGHDILASRYIDNTSSIILQDIKTEHEYKIVEDELNKRIGVH